MRGEANEVELTIPIWVYFRIDKRTAQQSFRSRVLATLPLPFRAMFNRQMFSRSARSQSRVHDPLVGPILNPARFAEEKKRKTS